MHRLDLHGATWIHELQLGIECTRQLVTDLRQADKRRVAHSSKDVVVNTQAAGRLKAGRRGYPDLLRCHESPCWHIARLRDDPDGISPAVAFTGKHVE
jgi:hypothetical protein